MEVRENLVSKDTCTGNFKIFYIKLNQSKKSINKIYGRIIGQMKSNIQKIM